MMKKKYRILLLSLKIICLITAISNTANASIQGRVAALIQSHEIRETAYAISIFDTSKQKYLVKINQDKAMIPASNMKILTTASAIHLLGPDFQFKTYAYLLKPSDWKNTLNTAGNKYAKGVTLVIKGDGDPSLGDPELFKRLGYKISQDGKKIPYQIQVNGKMRSFESVKHYLNDWVKTIQSQNVKTIDYLMIDDRVFNNQRIHPSWKKEDLNRWYAAEVSGFNFHNNCLDVFPMPTHRGQNTVVKISPSSNYISNQSRNISKTGSRNTFWVSRKSGTNQMVFRGEIKSKRKHPISVTVHDPALFFAHVLAEKLARKGIIVKHIGKPKATDLLPLTRRVIIRKEIQDLAVILNRCNKNSQNLYAESLIKRMGRAKTGTPGSWGNGAAAMRDYLRTKLGMRIAAIKIVDGSGLSQDNRVSASDFSLLLYEMLRETKLKRTLFFNSLSVGGTDGTLKKRFKGVLKGRVYAKTGTIQGVRCLSGYLWLKPLKDQRVITFSLMFNQIKYPVSGSKILRLQEKILLLIDKDLSK